MNIGMISLGCSKNRVNSEQMMFLLHRAGHSVSGETEGADVVILNTCGFIESAKTEAIETILELIAAKKEHRIGKLIVAGCFPERHKEEILSELPEIDAIVGTGSFDDITKVIENLDKSKLHKYFDSIDAPVSETPRIISTSPVWAYLKIAEGCDNRCSYCAIPDIRGRFRSRPVENIIQEAEKLADMGIRELIIVAQDVTRYGLDLYGELQLVRLLKRLNKIKKIKWIRLHYLYPDEFDDQLIDVIAKSGKILKYLDIPIQHISDDILKKMNRRGTSKDIKELFKKLRENIPGVVLRTSLITGLPGEGEKEFEELCDFLHEAKIERAGVFAYSPEDGTPAALMDRPAKEIAEQRAELIMDKQSLIMSSWNESRIGSTETVLIEDMTIELEGSIYYKSRSYAESPDIDGYILIDPLKSPSVAENTFVDVEITRIKNGELIGEERGFQH